MDLKRKGRSVKQRVALGIVCVLVFAYTVYHLSGIFTEEISTFAAGVTTETTALHYSGYVFRDETVLTAPYTGVVDYHVADGTKVSSGQALATVYEYGAEQRQQLRRVDEQIAVLEQGIGDGNDSPEMGELKKSVSTTYNSLVKMLAAGETGGLSYGAEKLLVGMNQMDTLANGQEAKGYQTLSALRSLREEMLAQSGGSITYTSSRSGYFYGQTDGLEYAFTMSAAEALTASSFRDLMMAYDSVSTDELAYGKISYSDEWMLVLPVDVSDGRYFEVGQVYEGIFEENNQTRIPLTLERVVETEEDELLLVFRADRLPARFVLSRFQTVRLEVDSISGIYVPRDVVSWYEGARGVFVLRGSVVYFRYIEILYEGSDYYLVKDGMESDGEYTYLQVNDMIILNGKNMFDGRVLD